MELMTIFWVLFSLATVIVSLFTLLGFLGRLWWVFDLFSHFRYQYLILLIMSSLIFIIGRKYSEALISSLFVVVNLALVLPLYIGGSRKLRNVSSKEGKTRTYRVLFSNVEQKNLQSSKLSELIRSTNPDLIALVEVNQAWMDELQPEKAGYPYVHSALREDNYGVAFFSRIPFESTETCYFGDAYVPTVIVRFILDGRYLTIIDTHPPPPKSHTLSNYRNHQLEEIAEFVSGQTGDVMVLGDLNITPWSPFFQEFLRRSSLRESRNGFGLQLSWPTDRVPFLVPIDHILVSKGIIINNRRVGPNVGSDHFPVILSFSIFNPTKE